MVLLPQIIDGATDKVVIHDIALGHMEQALLLPDVVGDMVTADTEVQCFPRQPEMRDDDVFIPLKPRREYHDKRRDVAGAGQVKAGITVASLEYFHVDLPCALVVDMLRYPCHCAADPLVKTKLSEDILFGRVLKRLAVGITHTVDLDGLSERGIGLIPVLLIVPIVTILQTEDHGIEGRVDALACQNVGGLGMILITDAVAVCTCRGDQEVERLGPGIAGALGQHIHQIAIGLCVELVQHKA